MKEFIEKLICRLEDEKARFRTNYLLCKYNRETYESKVIGIDNLIKIVNQLAEEYRQDLDKDRQGWIPCSKRLPEDDTKRYIVQKTNGYIDILGFSKDAYRLSRYDFYECKGKKKAIFFDYDSEYGYYEAECEAWKPLPAPYTENKVSEMPTGWKQNVMEKFEKID